MNKCLTEPVKVRPEVSIIDSNSLVRGTGIIIGDVEMVNNSTQGHPSFTSRLSTTVCFYNYELKVE